MGRVNKFLTFFFIGCVVVVGLFAAALNTRQVQDWVIHQLIAYIRDRYDAEVSFSKIRFSLANSVIVDDLLIKDQHADTMLSVHKANIYLTNWSFLPLKAPVVRAVELFSPRANVYQLDEKYWNLSFLVPSDTTQTSADGLSALQQIYLHDFAISVRHKTAQVHTRGKYFYVDVDHVHLDSLDFRINKITTDSVHCRYVFAQGVKPRDSTDIKPYLFAQERLQNGLRAMWSLPASWHVRSADLHNTTVDIRRDGVDSLRMEGSVFLQYARKNAREFAQTILLEQFRTGEYSIATAGVRLVIDKNTVYADKLFVRSELADVAAHAVFSYADPFGVSAEDFGNSWRLHGGFRIEKMVSSALLPYVSKAVGVYIPAESVFSVDSVHFSATQSSLSLDSVLIRQDGKKCLWGSVQVTVDPNSYHRSSLFFSVDNCSISLHPASSPALFARVCQLWDSASRPDISHIDLTLSYTGTLDKGDAKGTVALPFLAAQLDAQFERFHDSTVSLRVDYESTLKNDQIFPGNVSFSSLNGKARFVFARHQAMEIKRFGVYVNNLLLNGHHYSTLSVDGLFEQHIASGQITLDDPSAKVSMQYSVDVNDENNILVYARAHVHDLDLKDLGFTKQELHFFSAVDVNVSLPVRKKDSTRLYGFLGEVDLQNVRFVSDYGEYFLNDVSARARYHNQQNVFSLHSDELGDVVFNSNRPVQTAYALIVHKAEKLFPYLYKEPHSREDLDSSGFSLAINLKNLRPFNSLFDQRLTNLDEVYANIYAENPGDNMRISVRVPSFSWDSTHVAGLQCVAHNQSTDIDLFGRVDSVSRPRLFALKNIQFFRDSARRIRIQSDTGTWSVDCQFALRFLDEYTNVTLYPSVFVLNGQRWKMSQTGQAKVDGSFVVVDSISIRNRDQSVGVYSSTDDDHTQKLIVEVRHFSVNALMKLIESPAYTMGGILNADLLLARSAKGTQRLTLTFSMDEFTLNYDSVGKLYGALEYGQEKKILSFRADNPDFAFSARGNFDPDARVLLDVDVKKVRLRPLYFYTKSFFGDVGGTGNGKLQVVRGTKGLSLEGNIRVRDAYVLADYTQCRYNIKRMDVRFADEMIYFEKVSFRDVRAQKGFIDGYLRLPLSHMDDFRYDFHIRADDIVGLNTTREHNPVFYGNAVGKVDLRAVGNSVQDSLLVDVVAKEKTFCTFNRARTDVGHEDNKLKFISRVPQTRDTSIKTRRKERETWVRTFIKPKQVVASTPFFFARINVNTAGNTVGAELILNRGDQNRVVVRCHPHFTFSYHSQDGMRMEGGADIVKGKLSLVLLSDLHLAKDFFVDRTYKNTVNWLGDIASPTMNVKMVYPIQKVPLNSLESVVGSLTNSPSVVDASANPNAASGSRVGANTSALQTSRVSGGLNTVLANIDLCAIVSGTPDKLDIRFDIRLAPNSNLVTGNVGSQLNNYLQMLRQNQEQMRAQVSSLLLLNTFTTGYQETSSNPTTNAGLARYASQLASSVVSGLAFSQVNRSLNSLINSKVVSLGFDYNAYNTYQIGDANGTTNLSVQDIRNQIGFNVNFRVTDRLNFNISPGIDFNLYNNNVARVAGSANTTNFLPNASMIYNVTKDGFVTFNVFNSASYDNLIQSQRNRAGISLLLSRDFDWGSKHVSAQRNKTNKSKKKKQKIKPSKIPTENTTP